MVFMGKDFRGGHSPIANPTALTLSSSNRGMDDMVQADWMVSLNFPFFPPPTSSLTALQRCLPLP